jgi:hypothetical protein
LPIHAELVPARVEARGDRGVVLRRLAALEDERLGDELERVAVALDVGADRRRQRRRRERDVAIDGDEDAMPPPRLTRGDRLAQTRVLGRECVAREVDGILELDGDPLQMAARRLSVSGSAISVGVRAQSLLRSKLGRLALQNAFCTKPARICQVPVVRI